MIIREGIKYSDYTLNSAWGFAFSVKDYAREHLPCYFYPARVAKHFGCPHVQAKLALELLCDNEYAGRTRKGYYYIRGRDEAQARQRILTEQGRRHLPR